MTFSQIISELDLWLRRHAIDTEGLIVQLVFPDNRNAYGARVSLLAEERPPQIEYGTDGIPRVCGHPVQFRRVDPDDRAWAPWH